MIRVLERNFIFEMTQATLRKLLSFDTNLTYTSLGTTLLNIGLWIAYESKSFIELTHFGLKFVEDEDFKIDGIVIVRYAQSP